MNAGQTQQEYETTSWSLIGALHEQDGPARERALSLLVRRYWPPIYASFRRMGRDREEAAEITQSFFAEVILDRGLFDRADRHRGRMRALLLTAIKRYAVDQHRRRSSRPDQLSFSAAALTGEERFLASTPADSVEEVFEKRWAVALLGEAVARCEEYFNTTGQQKHWSAFEAVVLRPAAGTVARPSLQDVADELGFASAVHVASVLRLVRKRMRIVLREVVAETALDPEDQHAEYCRVVELLS